MTLSKIYTTDKTLDEVKAILLDIPLYGTYHPLIKAVEINDSQENYFTITERPYSWLPISIKYFALIKELGEKIVYDIKGLPLTSAKIEYTFAESLESKTLIHFTLTVGGIPIGKNILAYKMQSAQDQLMEVVCSTK